ncbi:DUF1345 domain-containing protein [Pedobacter sp. UBA4863]|uniref:DUF1345 domain-containing protein n=1 Tax=Pedobacter sp. UBA4863 TaxID=1947060 RepID=UPI0025F4457E|nr:DUF1345 domain-containing protein [Pedobacter sp. UBA4863]
MANKTLNKLHQLKALTHLSISFIAAVLGFWCAKYVVLGLIVQLMFAWVIFCAVQMGISWLTFINASVNQTKQHAAIEDGGRPIMFLIVLLSAFGGLLAVFVLLAKTKYATNWLEVTLSMLGMFLSWLLLHTIYTSRYAHLYYDVKNGEIKKGLQFPNDEEPNFIDFAYHSLVIGMTFQVSDINITSKEMRRLTLAHSLIAFVFNTCIVALTISAVAGLLG